LSVLSWLHISDLHEIARDEWSAHRPMDALLEDLRHLRDEKSLRPDFIFFTGDAAFGHLGDAPAKNIANQFEAAEKFFAQVRGVWNFPVTRFYLVPGNHDVNRSATVSGLYSWLDDMIKKHSDAELTKSIESNDANWHAFMSRLESYRAFLKAHKYTHCLSDPDRLISWNEHEVNGTKVGIAGLNTAWSCGRENEKRGDPWFASKYQLSLLESKIRGCDVQIALMHHPLDWGNEVEAPYERTLLRNLYRFSLHGHEHEQYVRAERHHVSIAAGAVAEGSLEACGYNFVQLDTAAGNGKVWLRSFYQNAERFDQGVSTNSEHGIETFRIPAQPSRSATKKHKPVLRPSPAMKDDLASRDGVILVMDYFDFSLQPPQAQLDGLLALHAALRKTMPKGALWNATADGAIVSFPGSPHTLSANVILSFIAEVKQKVLNEKVRLSLRFGVHCGAHYRKQDSESGRGEIFGTTVNDCIWLSAIGDGDDVVVSHTFFDDYVRNDTDVDANKFHPPADQSAWEFVRRSQRYLGVRLYVHTEATGTPMRVRMLDAISKRIDDELLGQEYLLRDLLRRAGGLAIAPQQLRARVCVWEKRLKDDVAVLYPTRFRFINPKDPEAVKPSATRYSLKGEGQGPPGRALVSGRPVVVNDLPKWDEATNGKAYVDALKHFDLDASVIRKWYRKSRSFICFPISMTELAPGELADACICIDCLHPLPKISHEKLMSIADTLREDADESLAPLWLLRLTK
jgi:hypothetical protein